MPVLDEVAVGADGNLWALQCALSVEGCLVLVLVEQSKLPLVSLSWLRGLGCLRFKQSHRGQIQIRQGARQHVG